MLSGRQCLSCNLFKTQTPLVWRFQIPARCLSTTSPKWSQRASVAPVVKTTSGRGTPGNSVSGAKNGPDATNIAPRINPPPTTRPPPLTLPQRGSDPFYKYAFGLGKAYLNFYKSGMKGIIANYKSARALPDLHAHPLFSSRRKLYHAAIQGRLSRAELQLLLRLRADMKVLPLFALVFLICGEFTPLVALYLTALVPPTLRIPSQTRTLHQKAEDRRRHARSEGPAEWRNIRNIWGLQPREYDDTFVQQVCQRMGVELSLYPAWWERIRPKKLYVTAIQSRLGKRLSELKYDDWLLMREGQLDHLHPEEVTMALARRGVGTTTTTTTTGGGEAEQRKQLKQWLEDRNTADSKKMVDWLQGAPVDWIYQGQGQGQKGASLKK